MVLRERQLRESTNLGQEYINSIQSENITESKTEWPYGQVTLEWKLNGTWIGGLPQVPSQIDSCALILKGSSLFLAVMCWAQDTVGTP